MAWQGKQELSIRRAARPESRLVSTIGFATTTLSSLAIAVAAMKRWNWSGG